MVTEHSIGDEAPALRFADGLPQGARATDLAAPIWNTTNIPRSVSNPTLHFSATPPIDHITMVTPNLLSPPSQIAPATALKLSQKAPLILASPPTSSLPWPLSLLLSSETPSSWTIHENLFFASLRTGDDVSARKILDRLTTRFGAENERITVLQGIYAESQAKSDKDLENVFKEYENLLREDPTNFAVRKRRVAILKSMGRIGDAITALTVLLEHSPTDGEAWAELADLYAQQGAWGQAIYSMEEVLLIAPTSWSVRCL